ncbi:MAG: phosphoglycerate dehydrogenase [Gemmatimonadota bacterium]|nr:phosphoglycerate dehydrogenase [Gemmatimonadota bacterium]
MSDLIFIALSTFGAEDRRPLAMLESSGCQFRIHSTGKRVTKEELARDGSDATVIVAGVEPYDVATLNLLPVLRCISRCGVGVDAIDLDAARGRGIVVANTPTIPIDAVAEMALAMFLSISRNLRPQANLMQARRWERLSAHLLKGRTVGLIGFGRIGQRVAQLCQAFGANVVAHDPMADPAVARKVGVTLLDKAELLAAADIVSLHASRNAGQPVLIGSSEMALMKRGAVLVNLARGEMVDEEALVAALKSGHLSGAGLDVFGKEPYQGALCDFEQVILTPHSATLTAETRAAMEIQCIENALEFLNGKVPADRRVI